MGKKAKAKQSKKYKKSKKQAQSVSDHQKAYALISRIYKELKNNQAIYFEKLRGFQGVYEVYDDEIKIDYRKEILPTIIHEFIHKFYPKETESWVLKKERFIVKQLSPSQAKRLLMAFCMAI